MLCFLPPVRVSAWVAILYKNPQISDGVFGSVAVLLPNDCFWHWWSYQGRKKHAPLLSALTSLFGKDNVAKKHTRPLKKRVSADKTDSNKIAKELLKWPNRSKHLGLTRHKMINEHSKVMVAIHSIRVQTFGYIWDVSKFGPQMFFLNVAGLWSEDLSSLCSLRRKLESLFHPKCSGGWHSLGTATPITVHHSHPLYLPCHAKNHTGNSTIAEKKLDCGWTAHVADIFGKNQLALEASCLRKPEHTWILWPETRNYNCILCILRIYDVLPN